MVTTILGIDPGTRWMGYGVVYVSNEAVHYRGHGTLVAPSQQNLGTRLGVLSSQMEAILTQYAPAIVIIEQIFLGKNIQSAFTLGHIRGVCMALAAQSGAQIAEYATRQVKKGITGNGNATKEHVQMVLRQEYTLGDNFSLDASDALALASFHGHNLLIKRRWQEQGKGQIS
jgi:crossover junction endodeoxyribonuclease RuvC